MNSDTEPYTYCMRGLLLPKTCQRLHLYYFPAIYVSDILTLQHAHVNITPHGRWYLFLPLTLCGPDKLPVVTKNTLKPLPGLVTEGQMNNHHMPASQTKARPDGAEL